MEDKYMETLANRQDIYVERTEQMAYKTLQTNLDKISADFSHKGLELKDIDELKRISNLGLLLNIPHPADKNSELYKLVNAEWNFFSSLGSFRDFTPNLSYRSITFILRLYSYSLNKPMSGLPEVPSFKLTEEECLELLNRNQEKLEASMHFKGEVKDLVNLKVLAEVLGLSINSTQNNIYNFIKRNWEVLSSIGCYKETKYYRLSLRGVVFLLMKGNYSLSSKFGNTKDETTGNKEPVKLIHPPVEQKTIKEVPKLTIVEDKPTPEVSKSEVNLLTRYVRAKKKELQAIAKKDHRRMLENQRKLSQVDSALLLIEDAVELLKQAGV